MLNLPTQLTAEVIISGVVGLLLAGSIIKKIVEGYIEARKKLNTQTASPMVAAMAAVWDRDQQERFLQLVERMTIALETQAKYQGSIADQQQHDMQEKLDRLLSRMDHMPSPQSSGYKKKGP